MPNWKVKYNIEFFDLRPPSTKHFSHNLCKSTLTHLDVKFEPYIVNMKWKWFLDLVKIVKKKNQNFHVWHLNIIISYRLKPYKQFYPNWKDLFGRI